MKIKVLYLDNVFSENGSWVFGKLHHLADTHTISISTKDSEGNPISEDSMNQTLRHELFHSIFVRGQYIASADDEPLVEWLALCTSLLNKQGLNI